MKIIKTWKGACYTFIVISFFILGMFAGVQIQTANMIQVMEAIQIEEMNINLNETKMVEAMIKEFNITGSEREEEKKQEDELSKGKIILIEDAEKRLR